MSLSRRKQEPDADAGLRDSPFGGDLDAELTPRPRARRAPRLTMVLGAGVLLVAGMVIGIQAHKTFGGDGRAGAVQALLAGGGVRGGGAARAGGPGAGQGPGQAPGQGRGGAGGQAGGAFGDVTLGTVKLVDGRKIYVETATGDLVVVTTTGDTKVQISKEGAVKDLKPGSTVVVQGKRGADGTVAATTVNQGGIAGRGAGTRGGR
ncbi:hypothetical protein [Sphaerisporangium aureirubrum]|uniref:DUF5666 domain-containing protein n=1 Tax=Sphaerisporangium aureirubrum TaxID=1544736 RepID=A0ABW1NT19_9ACTN